VIESIVIKHVRFVPSRARRGDFGVMPTANRNMNIQSGKAFRLAGPRSRLKQQRHEEKKGKERKGKERERARWPDIKREEPQPAATTRLALQSFWAWVWVQCVRGSHGEQMEVVWNSHVATVAGRQPSMATSTQ
jgi:hypothetical protein